MEHTDHITLPVSALKKEAGRVFDALAEGRTVYVSRYGEVVAAFQPDVPAEVTAAYALPQVATNELTARDMGRGVPTAAVNDAAGGLPSLVTRDHKVYGMLVHALPPAAPAAQDIDLQGAEASSAAMNAYLDANPSASIEEITSYRAGLDADVGGALPVGTATGGDTVERFGEDEIGEVRDLWTERGSEVEGTVVHLLKKRHDLVFAAGITKQLKFGQKLLISPTKVFREVAKLDRTDPVGAREMYVAILAAEPHQRAAMWMLGDLSRKEGYKREAAQWYGQAVEVTTQPPAGLPFPPAGVLSATAYKKAVAKRARSASRVGAQKAAGKPLAEPIGKAPAKRKAPMKKSPTKSAVRHRDRIGP